MIVFENEGEIDPRLITLIGVNVKDSPNAIGYFGTGLKYAIACLVRWSDEIRIQSGEAEFCFDKEDTSIRGQEFSILRMRSKFDHLQLGFTTQLGKNWEPWMIYRELWCNTHDERGPSVYEIDEMPSPKQGKTRVIVSGERILKAHQTRDDFILSRNRAPLHVVKGLEIYAGEGKCIFYRGIAVQWPSKPSQYTYNITEHLWLTEDRTAGGWSTDPIIARGLSQLEDKAIIDATILAPADRMESRLDYCEATAPSDTWIERAEIAVASKPFDTPSSVRAKFKRRDVQTCPTCGREM